MALAGGSGGRHQSDIFGPENCGVHHLPPFAIMKKTINHRSGPRLSLIALALAPLCSGPAWAQTAPAAVTAQAGTETAATAAVATVAFATAPVATAPLAMAPAAPATATRQDATQTVVVTGQRASMRKALAQQEQANHIVSVISSDDIGQLPDKNAAEALARLPGVAVQRDQGEGRYIVVRGLGPDYNAVTINGALVPSPEASRRAVALDVLPAGLIRSLEVSKTLTPDRDANSLGGTVEVKSLSAFDLPGQALNLHLGAGRDGNTGATNPNGGLLWARRFMDGKLGVALGASAEKRKFGSDNVETGGAWKDGRLSGFELRDYLPVRERMALALNLDYRPQAGQSYYLRTLASRFSDDEVRDRLTLSNFAKAIAPDETTTARAERRLRQRKYTQEINSVLLGSETRIADWLLALAAGASRATESTPESINDARFRGTSNFAGVGFRDSQRPALIGPASLQNPASYNLNGITLQARESQDHEHHLRWDLSRKFAIGELDSTLKFGSKWSRRTKENDTEQWAYNSSKAGTPNYWGAGPVSLASFVQGPLDYPFANLGPGINPDLIRARVAGLERAPARLLQESVLNDYRMQEDIDAAYLQTSTTLGNWQVLLGARHEHSAFSASGNQVQGSVVSAVSRQRSYGNWLPNLQLRYDLDQQTTVRAAITHSVVRANFSQLAPGINLVSNTEAVIGNPDLLPLKSRNLDLGIEHMLGREGAVSAYAFAKQIDNFTYTTDLAGTGAWTNYTSAISYANGAQARVSGLELSYSHALKRLPAPWNGLILGANLTLTRSDADISRFDKASGRNLTRQIRLPGQSAHMLNLMLGYEAGPVSARLALNAKSPYLLELGNNILDPSQDRIVDRQRQLDLSLSYQLTPALQLLFEGSNLNNEKYYVYQGSAPYNAQYESYGRTYKISLKARVF